ncbi:MAG TPA: efflux RND transporter permease subunit, partial [Candidatus Kapabacteria bacterium]|nr:efflux RND transporter permease subunit [Candidatus Kapabacteria bacterium]
ELGSDNKEAAAKGTDEVVVAVLAATMTNLVVFLPIAQMTSMVGLFFREFALTVTYATLFSLLVSFTVTPMLASLILPKEIKVGKIGAAIERYWSKVEQFYKRTLAWVLSRKLYASIVAFGSFTLLILCFIVLGPQIGFENFPRIDDSQVRIKVELPDGYNIDETAIVMAEIERRISQYPDVTKIITSLGKQGELDKNTNLAVMDVTVTDANQRETTLQEFITEFTNLLSDIPNAKIKVDFANNVGGPGAPIEFYLMGNDALVLEELKTKVVDEISDVPGLINFDNSSRSGKPEITIFPYREKIEEAGITVMDVAMTLRASMEGLVATTYREKGEEYDIKVKLFDDAYNTPEKVGNIPIATPNGAYRLSQLGEVRFTKGFAKILHRDKLTTIKFTGSPAAGVPLGQVTDEIEKRLAKIEMPAGYYYKWGGSAEMMKETVAEMLRAFLIAIVLTYMLLAALLEDLVQPLIIMSTLPLSFIGVFAILVITGSTMNTISMMAIIMLVGIVVNNAILILDYSNQLVRKGMSHRDALIEAAPTKLKPQIMASAAIILGMLPMALGIGDFGKELRMPLGIVSLGGLLVSTILTIYVIPSADYLNNAFGNAIFGKLKRIFKRQTA